MRHQYPCKSTVWLVLFALLAVGCGDDAPEGGATASDDTTGGVDASFEIGGGQPDMGSGGDTGLSGADLSRADSNPVDGGAADLGIDDTTPFDDALISDDIPGSDIADIGGSDIVSEDAGLDFTDLADDTSEPDDTGAADMGDLSTTDLFVSDVPADSADTADTGPPASCARADLVSVPTNHWGYEITPNIIRNDGIESFIVEVFLTADMASTTSAVWLTNVAFFFEGPHTEGDAPDAQLFDDGLGSDRSAGDDIYTAGPFSWSPDAVYEIGHLANDPDSPDGLMFINLATVRGLPDGVSLQACVDDTNLCSTFLLSPTVGILRSDVEAVESQIWGESAQASAHVLNLCTTQWTTQSPIRFQSSMLSQLTKAAFEYIPDDYDFFALFSTYKMEHTSRTQRSNFTAGLYSGVRSDATGIGRLRQDSGDFYGSAEQLQGMLFMDYLERGITSQNLTHELLHQWGAYFVLQGLNDGGVHYNMRGNTGSLLGGFRWDPLDGGGFDCNWGEGRNGAHQASPLDLYLMGLIQGEDVPDIYWTTDDTWNCSMEGPVPAANIQSMTLASIQTRGNPDDANDQVRYGVRTPGPDEAQRDFRFAFIAETRGRLLTETEITAYSILAEHYTSAVPEEDPDPHVNNGTWAPMTRFFPGTTWRSDLTLLE